MNFLCLSLSRFLLLSNIFSLFLYFIKVSIIEGDYSLHLTGKSVLSAIHIGNVTLSNNYYMVFEYYVDKQNKRYLS